MAARLALRTNQGRALVYESSATADATGRYEIPVAYANRGQRSSVAVSATYKVSCQGERREVVVTGSLVAPMA